MQTVMPNCILLSFELLKTVLEKKPIAAVLKTDNLSLFLLAQKAFDASDPI